MKLVPRLDPIAWIEAVGVRDQGAEHLKELLGQPGIHGAGVHAKRPSASAIAKARGVVFPAWQLVVVARQRQFNCPGIRVGHLRHPRKGRDDPQGENDGFVLQRHFTGARLTQSATSSHDGHHLTEGGSDCRTLDRARGCIQNKGFSLNRWHKRC
jgi:hypothetical protein